MNMETNGREEKLKGKEKKRGKKLEILLTKKKVWEERGSYLNIKRIIVTRNNRIGGFGML